MLFARNKKDKPKIPKPAKLYIDPVTLEVYSKKNSLLLKWLYFVLVAILFGATVYAVAPYIRQTVKKEMVEIERLEQRIKVLDLRLETVQAHDIDLLRSVLNMDSLPQDIREGGFGGIIRNERLTDLKNGDLIMSLAEKIENLTTKIVVQEKSLNSIATFYSKKKDYLSQTPAIEPVIQTGRIRYTSGFGYRTDPFLKIKKLHKGMDFSAPTGTNVIATADGVVEKLKYSGGYGKQIIVKHNERYKTRYAHLSEILVKQGEKIVRGEIIGKTGNSGRSTAPHLHYEVLLDEKQVNPIKYVVSKLSFEQYNQLVELSENENISLD